MARISCDASKMLTRGHSAAHAMVSSPPQDTIAEALRLAVVVASARGALDPLDLAAAELALCLPGLAEDASQGWARAHLPLLVGDPRRGTRASRGVPFGATSWRAIFRRAHNPDAKLAIGAGCGFRVDDRTGRLWSWGEPGAVLCSENMKRAPAPMRGFAPKTKVTAVSVGSAHALACDSAGAVWAWGDASHGKLGTPLGEEEKEPPSEGSSSIVFDPPSSTPRRVAGFGAETRRGLRASETTFFFEESITSTFAVSVAAGVEHSVAVDAAGGAWAWGSDAYGQCGRRIGAPAPACSPRPARLEGLFRGGARVVAAAAGKTTTLLLDETGRVWRCFSNAASVGAWAEAGSTFGGPPCFRSRESSSRDDSEGSQKKESVRASECVRAFAEHLVVTHVALTHEHALLIDRRGDAHGWGRSGDGATGVGVRVAAAMAGPLRGGALRDAGRLRRAAVSAHHSLVLACDGSVYGFGKNASHELDERAGATSAGPLRVAVPPSRRERATDKDAAAAACVAVAAGAFVENGAGEGASFSFSRGVAVGASAATRASDGRVLTWGAPRAWLGRGGRADEPWAPGNEPAPVRFEETEDDETFFRAKDDGSGGTPRAAAVA